MSATLIALPLLACGLGGCAATDPLTRPVLWNPSGVNEANIAVQVVNPADLVQGRSAPSQTDGMLAAAAVRRLRLGRVKELPDSGLTDLRVQGAPTGAAGAPASAADVEE
ncbi:MAG: hypothetical protein M3Y41_01935 [Pseudomonadota bacterium]|nr:hypothetical protein [Pseudomonadota bacterium]